MSKGGQRKERSGGESPEALAMVGAAMSKEAPRKRTFKEEIRALVNCGKMEISADLIRRGEDLGVNAREYHSAMLHGDKLTLKKNDARLARHDCLVVARESRKIDAEISASFEGTGLEVQGTFDEGWRRAHPGREPVDDGEVQRWIDEQDAATDAERDAHAEREEKMEARAEAFEAARANRDRLPPVPSIEEIEETFRGWFRKNWGDRQAWPTVDDLRMSLALPGGLIRRTAKAGRWGARNVCCFRPSGVKRGRTPERVSPAGLAQVLRAFGARNPCFAEKAAALAAHLKKG